MPAWFQAKAFAILVAYMFTMQTLADRQENPDLLYIWFGTGLPIAWLGASIWHWVVRPKPRRSPGEVVGIWKRAVLRAPGISMLYAGMVPVVLIFGARVAITRDVAVTSGDDILAVLACGIFGLAAVVGLGAWLVRSGRRSG